MPGAAVPAAPAGKAPGAAGHAKAPATPTMTQVPPSETLLAMVPASGPLSERELVLLAIANSPELERRRVAIAVAYAQRRAVNYWENPELRVSYAWQDDDFLSVPYTETGREEIRTSERFSGTETESSLAQLGELGFGESTIDRESGTASTRRYREIERRVTPGRGMQTVDTRVYEVREDRSNGTRSRTQSDLFTSGTRRDRVNENVQRRLVSQSRETVQSPDWTERDQLGLLMRFRLPNPVERMARFERAAAEISLAEAQYLADEDQMVRDVRGLCLDIAVLESQLTAHQKRRQGYLELYGELERLNQPEFAMDKARARIDMYNALEDIREVENDIVRLKTDLAALCGLESTHRIRTGGLTVRRVVEPGALDPAWLVEMAMVYRSDVLESRARQAIARARMKEERAAKVPFATFVDAGWQRNWVDGRYGNQDEWMIRAGIQIPFFDWLGINKRDKAFQAEMEAWEKQVLRQRQRIAADVALAIQRMRESAAQLADFEKDIAKQGVDARKAVAELEASMTDIGDFTRPRRMRAEFTASALQLEAGRYEGYADYNKALMALEDALGVRVEKVLAGPRPTGAK